MKNDEESRRLLADTVDDILKKPDPFDVMEKNSMIDIIITVAFFYGFMFTLLVSKNISITISVLVSLMAIMAIYAYYKNMRKIESTRGKIFIDSVTYLEDVSFLEQETVISYELISNESIGLHDDRFYTMKALDENGDHVYYVSRVPLNQEMFTTSKVVTPYGVADGIGVSITSRIIDIIYDPVNEKRIPVKQVLMSPSIATLDIIELEPVGENQAKIIPILVDIETETNVRAQKVESWAVKCAVCAGNLDIDAINHTDVGAFIECEYCGTNNGLRTIK